jgi:hypothetical protein
LLLARVAATWGRSITQLNAQGFGWNLQHLKDQWGFNQRKKTYV